MPGLFLSPGRQGANEVRGSFLKILVRGEEGLVARKDARTQSRPPSPGPWPRAARALLGNIWLRLCRARPLCLGERHEFPGGVR